MKIAITGAKGMLARTLIQHWEAKHELALFDVEEFDLRDAGATLTAIAEASPEVVVHCAAMTQVDACESEQDKAFAVNAIGSAHIAQASRNVGAKLVAISTDYVFAGDAERPYHEWDAADPRSVYGASKWAGEEAIRHHAPDHIIARIAWLYGAGGPSFVHTMLKLGQAGGDPLKVVNDQIGNPTCTASVPTGLDTLLDACAVGTYHLTCEGETSWYEFTKEIFRLKGFAREVFPCTSDEYPRPAPRPANSRLEKRALRLAGMPAMPSWQDALRDFFDKHPEG